MPEIPEVVQKLVKEISGEVKECGTLPDGSGFATASMPLPKNHWLYAKGRNIPPMPFRIGTDASIGGLSRNQLAQRIREAARYAIRAATMNGADTDFDPDALIQNLIVGLLGYWTANGLSLDPQDNP